VVIEHSFIDFMPMIIVPLYGNHIKIFSTIGTAKRCKNAKKISIA
jgi:hypothetical protein